MRRDIGDPSWKSGPKGPKHSDHWIDASERESDAFDVDGPSINQDERTEGYVLVVIREGWVCQREGCDADTTVDYVYSYDDLKPKVQDKLEDYFGFTGERLYEECSMNAVIVDHGPEYPYVGINLGSETVGYLAPQWSEKDAARGGCNGNVDEATILGI